MALCVHLLGLPQISCDDQPIEIPGYRPLALLAYLLITGVPHSRQHLVDLLFDDSDDPRASLRWTLSKLRSAIGADYLRADRQKVTFNFESDHWLDVTAFEAGQTDLYRGDFLEGLHVRDAYRFEDWLFFERERLRSCYQEALAGRLGECEEQGNDLAVIETAHQLLRLDNLRENWYRTLMRAYARLGKREAALAQYAQCRQVLEAELGVEPVAETAALADAIEAGRVQPEILEVRAAAREMRPVPKPVFQPRFPTSLVGRAAEMGALRQVWGQAFAGRGQLALVEGEPGIGKTRLIEEMLTELSGQAIILRAKCPELEHPLAYTLFADPLREALSGDRPPGVTDNWLAEIARLLPELHNRYPELPQPDPLDPDAERRRLFDAVCATLLSLTEERSLVLFLDDLQWADHTSLELLSYFSDWATETPVLIIGAYRRHEVGVEHPVRRLRDAWKRAGSLTDLRLGPLPEAAVHNLLQELTTWRGDDPSFESLIYRETGGNPLFVLETVASLRGEGRLPESAEGWQRDFRAETLPIPTQVQAIIENRLNRLDDLSRQVIAAAAVMQGSFTPAVVQAVSGRSELETLEGLERLLAGGLLVEYGKDRITFSHDKIREVAYEGLSQLRRKLLHRRMAETLERRHRGQEQVEADRLAYHYERAGDGDKALDYYLLAGQSAWEQYAYAATIGHYQKALPYLKEQKDYERAARTLMQLGLTYHNVFEFQLARQAYQEGFELWQRASEMSPAAQLSSALQSLRMLWDNPPSLDSTRTSNVFSEPLIRQLFSGLAELNPDLEVVPDVARDWEMLEGGQEYLFHLRDDVRWSDGVAVTASDFEYAWKRILNPATGARTASHLYDIRGARAFHLGQLSDPDEIGVRALDDFVLLVELEGPTSYFLHWLTGSHAFPVPQHAVEAYGEAWAEPGNIVTNGPFRLENWRRNEGMVLARNPDYHGQFEGNLGRVQLTFLEDEPAALGMYEADELDVLEFSWLAPPERDRTRHKHAGEYISFAGRNTHYVGFPASCPPFDDLRVRQAFALATDQERLSEVVVRGYVSPALGGFVPPGLPGHSTSIGLPYDPDRARQLLAEAGYVGGRDFPLISAYRPRVGSFTPYSDYLSAQWREILGIEVSWHDRKPGVLPGDLGIEGPYISLQGWMVDYPDPDNILRLGVQGMQQLGWRNEAYSSLVEKARRVTDQAERMRLYRQADRILTREAAILPLAYERLHLLVKPWVIRYPVCASEWMFWRDVIIEPR